MNTRSCSNYIHLRSPGNWINDPNGFLYYQGMYHLFYQYFPYATAWGTMHWGHAISPDLVHWEHQDIALFPSRYEDQNGCFSGSAIEHHGKMYLFYTGVHYEKPDPHNIHLCLNDQFEASQLLLISKDGKQFDNFNGKQLIIPPITDPSKGDITHTRDPKVWRGKDAWYMVLGSSMEVSGSREGRLLFFRSTDLTNWEYVNSVSKPGAYGWMWECPDYFETPGGNVLIFSPMGMRKDGYKEENHAICMLADFDEGACTIDIPDHYQYIDYGLDLYAPQTTLDAAGRRVMAAWIRMPQPVDEEWIGIFCIPRIVEVEDGHIYFRVHPNIDKQFTRKIDTLKEVLDTEYKVSLELGENESVNIGGYQITCKENRIYTDRTAVMPDTEGIRRQFCTPVLRDGCHLDIYVEPHLIEVFVNNGEYVISSTVYGLGKEIVADRSEQIAIFFRQNQKEEYHNENI